MNLRKFTKKETAFEITLGERIPTKRKMSLGGSDSMEL